MLQEYMSTNTTYISTLLKRLINLIYSVRNQRKINLLYSFQCFAELSSYLTNFVEDYSKVLNNKP